MVRTLSRPRREVTVGPFNWAMVFGFRFLPSVYDLLVGPLMARVALGREPVPNSPGNVLEPLSENVEVPR